MPFYSLDIPEVWDVSMGHTCGQLLKLFADLNLVRALPWLCGIAKVLRPCHKGPRSPEGYGLRCRSRQRRVLRRHWSLGREDPQGADRYCEIHRQLRWHQFQDLHSPLQEPLSLQRRDLSCFSLARRRCRHPGQERRHCWIWRNRHSDRSRMGKEGKRPDSLSAHAKSQPSYVPAPAHGTGANHPEGAIRHPLREMSVHSIGPPLPPSPESYFRQHSGRARSVFRKDLAARRLQFHTRPLVRLSAGHQSQSCRL
jgi:hypothetical protein